MYHVTYLRQPWSEIYESAPFEEFTRHPTGEMTLDCGRWSSILEFTEGVYPGTYLFTPMRSVRPHSKPILPYPEETFIVMVGHPDLPDPTRVAGDTL